MIFNPILKRDNAFSPEMIEYFLATEYEPGRPMGNVAISKVADCVYGVLVGRFDRMKSLLPELIRWMDGALSADDGFGEERNFYISRLSSARALAVWLASGDESASDWKVSGEALQAVWQSDKENSTRHEIVNRSGLDDYMASALLAGEESWKDGIDTYEKWMGVPAKLSLAGKPSPKTLAYAMLLNLTGRQCIPDSTLHKAGKAVLAANLQRNWLGVGQALRAATWLKVVHGSREPSLGATQILLKAYEDMPDVTDPRTA